MNKGNLIFAVSQGLILGGWLFYAVIEPKSKRFTFSPNLKGEYVDSLEEDSYRADIKKYPNGVLLVTYEPHAKVAHYGLAVGIAVCFGILQYRNLQDQAKKKLEKENEDNSPPIGFTPDEDSVYEEFLQENSNRRFVPRAKLEEEFQAWLAKRDESGGKEA